MNVSFATPTSAAGVGPIGPVSQQGRRGAAVVEFAILAPFLVSLIIGMCELGRAVMVKDILTNSARMGCRTGATLGKGYQDIISDVDAILTASNISTTYATITIQTAAYTGTSTTPSWASFTTVTSSTAYNPNPLDKISVKVSIPVADVLWFSPYFMSSTSIESELMIMLRQG
jgi:Flp pilus assembly protein TadG